MPVLSPEPWKRKLEMQADRGEVSIEGVCTCCPACMEKGVKEFLRWGESGIYCTACDFADPSQTPYTVYRFEEPDDA